MPAQPPLLDTRTLAQIVQQLLGRAGAVFGAEPSIPHWRLARLLSEQEALALLAGSFDDPGLMLALTYARLLELALQRLNQVPEKNLLAFLDTMGVGLLAPTPARVPLAFTLTPGTPATLVPRGAQAVTLPSAQQPAIVFETDDDLTVVPASLAASFTVDPTWDRYTDQTGQLGGSSPFGFTPFVGTEPLPHRLYLGDRALLDVAPGATVTLETSWTSAEPPATVEQLHRRLAYRLRSGGALETLTPLAVDVGPGQASVQLPIPGPVDLETLQGVGLEQGLEGRWLRAELTSALPDEPVAASLRLDGLSLRASASGLTPDLAFANTAPLDLSTDFLPFGESPKVGDAFYLASAEAFVKPGVNVTLSFEQSPLPTPKLRWEYSTDGAGQQPAWRPLLVIPAKDDDELKDIFQRLVERFFDTSQQPIPFLVDGTGGLTRDGRLLGLAFQMTPGLLNGMRASWVRARLASGSYSVPPNLAALVILALSPQGQAVTRPPEIGFVDQSPIDFGRPFLPFGPTPSPTSTFAFGEASQPFPSQIIKDRPASLLTFEVKLDPDPADLPPAADLRWEYLGPSGWSAASGVADGTLDLRRGGSVSFTIPDAVQGEVNGQSSYWVRARINSGSYGEPADFEPVDPDDPKQGFRPRPGTGAVQAPQLRSASLSYEAQGAPTAVTENGFLYAQPSGRFAPFVAVPDLEPAIYADSEPAFYLGFDAAFPEQPVSLYVAAAPRAFAGSVIRGADVTPLPSSVPTPLRWEYFDGTGWSELIVFDGTTGLTESGRIQLLTPPDIAPLAKFDPTPRYWVRARSTTNDPFDTQRLQGVFLNAVPAVQAVSVRDETLGSSNGQPGQQLCFARPPVLPGQQVLVREPEAPSEQERAAILAEEGPDAVQERPNPVSGAPEVWVRWHEVGTFLRSDPRSRHYLLDHASGLLVFGDGERGMIPPSGTRNLLASYQSGGGPAGNVPAGAVGKIQSPLPGLAAVTSPVAADGGAGAETVAQVEERGPQTLRHRQRAVSASDFEWLARQAAGTRVARARCLPNVNRELRFEPGWVTLIVVPRGAEARLSPGSELIREVQDALEASAFAGLAAGPPTRVNVIGPGYLQVLVSADVVPLDLDEAEAIKQRAIGALDAFFHPLTGSPRGTGWEFARDVFASEVSQVLEGVAGVSYVKRLELLANLAQHRLSFNPKDTIVDKSVPWGVRVMRPDARKSAVLAESLPAGVRLSSLAMTGFKEGDRLTRVLDLTLPDPISTRTVQIDGVARPAFTVAPLAADAVGFPRGSRLTSFDVARQTRLARAIPAGEAGLSEIVVEDDEFVAGLRPGAVLTVFYPFPLTVNALTLDDATGLQTLAVEPYEAAAPFPAGSGLASLDNRVRLPLASPLPADVPVSAIALEGFQSGEQVTLDDGRLGAPTIEQVARVTDVVYLDENFLVYPGPHRITMRAE